MGNRLGYPRLIHTHTHVCVSHTDTHAEVRSLHLSKAPPNYELLRTIMNTMRGPWPHKSIHNQPEGLPHSHHCPTLHTHTYTMATPEPGVPLCNSVAQRHTPVLIPSERERERKEWQCCWKKNHIPWVGMEENNWNTKCKVCVWWGCR